MGWVNGTRRGRRERAALSEEGAQKPYLWAVALVFALFGLGMMVWSGSQAYTAFSLRDHGVTTQARIVSIQQAKQTECEVEYQDSVGNWHEAWFDYQCVGMQPGQTIPVKYLSSDPSTAAAMGTLTVAYIAINKSGYMFVGFVVFAFGALGILACTGLLQRWIEHRRSRRISDARPK